MEDENTPVGLLVYFFVVDLSYKRLFMEDIIKVSKETIDGKTVYHFIVHKPDGTVATASGWYHPQGNFMLQRKEEDLDVMRNLIFALLDAEGKDVGVQENREGHVTVSHRKIIKHE